MTQQQRLPTEPNASPLVYKSAVELTEMLRSRVLSSVDLVKAYIAHIEAHNPALNAVITLDKSGALARAAQADAALAKGECWGPLHGLPMTVKDAIATANIRTTFGSPDTENYVPDTDAAIVAAVKAAGAIILGKTNIPTVSYDWQCQHPTAEQANNPHDLSRTPGGSSGGAAAALAAGFTPLEIGSDTAGSIRLPAHFCGVCGLRPTEGLLSDAGHMALPGKPRTLRSLCVVGPLARNLEDLQMLLSVLREYSSPSGMRIAPGPRQAVPSETSALKLAWTPHLGDVPVSAESMKVYDDYLQTLADSGCQIEETNIPGIQWETLLDLWGLVQGGELSAFLPRFIRSTPLRRMLPYVYWWWRIGRSRAATSLSRGMTMHTDEYLQVLAQRDRIVQIFDQFLSQYDGWLAPVAPVTAIRHCKPGTPIQINSSTYAYADVFGLYLAATAVPGTPAVSFPIGKTDAMLPVGIQLMGRRWQDEQVLAIARTLESLAAGQSD